MTASVAQHLLEESQTVSMDQVQKVIAILRRPVVDICYNGEYLGMLEKLGFDLEQTAKLTEEQVELVMMTVMDQVEAYKNFSMMDYAAGEAQDINSYQENWGEKDDYVADAAFPDDDAFSIPSYPTYATLIAASATEDVAITDNAAPQSAKDNGFVRFWREKEEEICKEIGYSKEQLVENYLSMTLRDDIDDWLASRNYCCRCCYCQGISYSF